MRQPSIIRHLPPAEDALERPGLAARLHHRIARHVAVSPFAVTGAPCVSFSFDDAPVSAATTGAELMEEHGARATFYVAGGLLGTQDLHWRVIGGNDLVDLHARGHEIGCHSHSHVRADAMTGAEIEADILQNRDFLKRIEPSLPLENFAYPFGHANLTWKLRLRRHFRSSRGIWPDVNQGSTDAQYLHAVPLIDRELDAGGIDRAFDRAMRGGGWVIFYSHDVAARPSDYGCSPGLLRHALRAAERFGLKIETVSAALTRMGARISYLWLVLIPLA